MSEMWGGSTVPNLIKRDLYSVEGGEMN